MHILADRQRQDHAIADGEVDGRATSAVLRSDADHSKPTGIDPSTIKY